MTPRPLASLRHIWDWGTTCIALSTTLRCIPFFWTDSGERSIFMGPITRFPSQGPLVRAGFDLEFEDETDSSRTHCEFTATFPSTGKKFSVEAKMRLPGKASVDVGNQLY